MTRVFAFLIPCFLLSTNQVNASEIYLNCELKREDGVKMNYTFSFDSIDKKLFMVNESVDMELEKISSTRILAKHDKKFYREFNYDLTIFELNRVNGFAKFMYLKNPSLSEKNSCLKLRNWGCSDFMALTKYDEIGYCVAQDRVIK